MTLPLDFVTAETHYYARSFCTDTPKLLIIVNSSHDKINNYFVMYAVANLLWMRYVRDLVFMAAMVQTTKPHQP